MTASRMGKQYPKMAAFLTLAVPLELISGSSQPHVEIGLRVPGYVNVSVPAAVTGAADVAAQASGSVIEPEILRPRQTVQAGSPHLPFLSNSLCPQPRYPLLPHERAHLRLANSRSRFQLRGHRIRGRC